jgi:hypothetical protein
MLLETARELGAETRTNAEVVEVAEDCRSVRLASGEVLKADVIVGADGSHGICRSILLPQDPPKPTGLTLFKYVFPPPFFPVLRSTSFLIMKSISSVIPADRIYADPELRSLVEQEQVIIASRSAKVDLIFTEGFSMGMVWAPTSIDLLPYRMSWLFSTVSPSQLLSRVPRETSHGTFTYETMEQKKDGTRS